ncbi:MAG: H-NS histone family protein [Paraburkholderia sp.]|uniref:H-NS histone family protein n=2 Tax=Burkholderiaceae TaxID=119060 RepID=UPI0024B6366F|nr:H-NS histone family protein [Burkholderia sp. 4M9327F10]
MKDAYPMDERKRDSIIAYLRHRMAEFGITTDDLASSLASDQAKQTQARYRSATGDIWSGEGEMPQWLKAATSAGQSIEHFETSPKQPAATQAKRDTVNWRDDPFAGSPLARRENP